MTRRAAQLAFQRLTSLLIGVLCVATIGALPWGGTVLLGCGAVLTYAVWPVQATAAQFQYARGPAVVVPDLLALALISFFAGLPFVAGRSEGTVLHPSLALLWPMAAVFVALPVLTWRRAVFGLTVGDDGLVIEGGTGSRRIGFDRIAALRPWRRDLLAGVRPLVPLLVSAGQFGTAGAVLVARESRGVMLCLCDGTRLAIPGDGLERGLQRLRDACEARAIPFEPGPCPVPHSKPHPQEV